MNVAKSPNLTKLGGVVYPQGVIPNTTLGGPWAGPGWDFWDFFKIGRFSGGIFQTALARKPRKRFEVGP